jgi:hypothetical protein
VRVRLTPRSSADAVEGIEATADGPAIKARVRAVPSDGEANAAVERLLADWLDVPKRTVSVTSGQKSRVKLLTVAGNPDMLERRLATTLVQHRTSQTS